MASFVTVRQMVSSGQLFEVGKCSLLPRFTVILNTFEVKLDTCSVSLPFFLLKQRTKKKSDCSVLQETRSTAHDFKKYFRLQERRDQAVSVVLMR